MSDERQSSGRSAADRPIAKAIALNYAAGDPSTPAVAASGRGAFAERILELAFEHGVKVREDADLVEILQKLEIGDAIPAIAFAAVAEILLHVYRWELAEAGEA